MAAFAAARSAFRSASNLNSARTAASKFASAAAKPKASPSPFHIPSRNPLSHRIFRSPVEMSAISVETMLPFHTATASALLNSMLSAAPRSVGWTLEDPPLQEGGDWDDLIQRSDKRRVVYWDVGSEGEIERLQRVSDVCSGMATMMYDDSQTDRAKFYVHAPL